MEQPYDYTEEDHIREVERALMYIAEAKQKAEEIAEALEREGAEQRLISGLRTAAAALRAEHNRLLNTSHFPVPDAGAGSSQQRESEPGASLLEPRDATADEPAVDQQRMAI